MLKNFRNRSGIAEPHGVLGRLRRASSPRCSRSARSSSSTSNRSTRAASSSGETEVSPRWMVPTFDDEQPRVC
ncbi:hypothetical protein K7G98_32670, partial [Saccharothrix sp. MB29]|nr:hypothetical protein [Saccharothrix sp. MB29]